MNYKRVLTIAGSDSGGGAGIQADIKVISACACFATSAITAITAQNTLGIYDIFPIPNESLRKQIIAVLEDIGSDAVKIGMLLSSESVKVVADSLKKFNIKNIVLDPVIFASCGDNLLEEDAIDCLKKELFSCIRVITPNIPEAEILLGKKISSQAELSICAKELSNNRQISVYLKAGHIEADELIDIFYNAETDEIIELKAQRIDSKNTHGTGCTLSSALASFLAQGLSLNEAVKEAKYFTNNAIKEGLSYEIGSGHGPVHHFHEFWK